MFTGIVAAVGEVRRVTGGRLAIESLEISERAEKGESIAVNGVCLTVVAIDTNKKELRFDLSPETQQRTSLGQIEVGIGVNLERALAVGDRLSGHLMQGHVDTTGKVLSIAADEESYKFVFQVDERFDALLVEKGSVAVDGISLTPFNICKGKFEVAVIPHTFANTTLRERKSGDKVNVEFDILAKYVQRQLRKETKTQ